MPKRRSAAKSENDLDSAKVTPPSAPRPPLPSTSRSYGKVAGGKGGKLPVPKTFSHRKRG